MDWPSFTWRFPRPRYKKNKEEEKTKMDKVIEIAMLMSKEERATIPKRLEELERFLTCTNVHTAHQEVVDILTDLAKRMDNIECLLKQMQ